jgi:hypothetical protein
MKAYLIKAIFKELIIAKTPCLKYEAEQVNHWLHKEQPPFPHFFVFQFYLKELNKSAPLKLVSYVVDDKEVCLNKDDPDKLFIAKNCPIIKLQGPTILSNTYISIQKIKDLIGNYDYDYLLLTPQLSSRHIIYKIRLRNGDIDVPGADTALTNPCPPATLH